VEETNSSNSSKATLSRYDVPHKKHCCVHAPKVTETGLYKIFFLKIFNKQFELRFESFVAAVKAFKAFKHLNPLMDVKIVGVSQRVAKQLTEH